MSSLESWAARTLRRRDSTRENVESWLTSSARVARALVISGRYPPPITGQALATRRLADLMKDEMSVIPVAMSSERRDDAGGLLGQVRRVRDVLDYRAHIRRVAERDRCLVYANVGGTNLGVCRDIAVSGSLNRFGMRIGWLHNGSTAQVYDTLLGRLGQKLLWEQIDRWVLPAASLARQFRNATGLQNVAAISNCIDREVYFSRAEIETIIEGRRRRGLHPQVLLLSTMFREKGVVELVKAIVPLLEDGAYGSVRLLGRWPDAGVRRSVEDILRLHAGIAQKIAVEGEATRLEVRKALAQADVLALPTYYPLEAAPMCILEAMNAALPVVATRHAGISDFVADGVNGILVPPGCTESLRTALRRLAQQRVRALMGLAGRDRFEDEHSFQEIRRRWVELLTLSHNGAILQ